MNPWFAFMIGLTYHYPMMTTQTTAAAAPTTYTTTAQKAATVRKALKALGWGSRQVSVRSQNFAGGSSINVTLNDPDIPVAPVEAILRDVEDVRRCELTGEILSGGNTYTHVRRSREALDAIAARVLPAVEAALATVTGEALAPVAGTDFWVGVPPRFKFSETNYRITVWRNQYVTDCYTPRDAARIIGAPQG